MSKGTRRERECVEAYQKAGWATYRPATVQYGENDMFGLFDIMAVSPDHCNPHAVQVKSNRAVGIRKWARHTALFRRLGFRTFYAVPYDNEGWRMIECVDTGPERSATWDVLDERELSCNFGEGLTEYLKA